MLCWPDERCTVAGVPLESSEFSARFDMWPFVYAAAIFSDRFLAQNVSKSLSGTRRISKPSTNLHTRSLPLRGHWLPVDLV